MRCGWRSPTASQAPTSSSRITATAARNTRATPSAGPRRSRRLSEHRLGRHAYDTAIAESFVDNFKTELIRDRVWRTRSQLERAIVEYVAWFNNERLHGSLGDRPPGEVEALYASRYVLTPSLNQ